jgi:hypothetical protein
MPRPGVTITTSAAAAAATPGQRLGTWMVAAETQRGPLVPDPTAPLRSLADYTRIYGGRDATIGSVALTYDAVEAYFRAGGSAMLLSRVVGPTAVVASYTIVDRATPTPASTIKVSARGPGAWPNTRMKVCVANGASTSTFVITILVDDVAVEVSPDLASPTEAVTWGTRSSYVTVSDLASATAAPNNNPAVTSATALASGADDIASITDTHWTAALNALPASWGPGLVTKLGVTTAAGHAGTMVHAAACNRLALLDGVTASSQATLTTLAQTVQGAATAPEYGMLLAPWLTIPPASGAVANRHVPPSAVAAGLISAQVTTGPAGKAAAGPNGQALWVLDTAPITSGGVGQTFTDAERDALSGNASVNVLRRAYSASANPPVELYGYSTLGTLSNGWRDAASQLLRLRITDELQLLAEQFIFQVLDGRGHTITAFGGAIAGIMQQHWEADELYGDTPADAYSVDVSSVNTPDTLAAGYLNARVNIRTTRTAEFLAIDVVKVPINQSL